MSDDTFNRHRTVFDAAGFPSPVRPIFKPAPAVIPPPLPRRPGLLPSCLALIATRNRLPFAQVAARSFLAHHPDFFVFLLLVDGEPDDAALFREGHVVFLADLNMPHAGWYAAKFSASEFCNALKPVFLRYLTAFAAKAIYINCDIAVFSRLTEMLDLLETRDLVLVPRTLTPPPRPEQFRTHPTRAEIFNGGLVDAGSFAIRLTNCDAFLNFWSAANLAPGSFYDGAGNQTDQHYLNWAVVNMPGACLLRDTRYNVGYPNLHERDFRLDRSASEDGEFKVGDSALGYFRFSGYDIADRLRLSRYDQRHSVYDLPAVAEILNWYSDEILGTETAALRHEPYGFDLIANGLTMNPFLRNLLKKYEAYTPKFDSRSQEGADCLSAFYMDPLPATASMLPLVAAEIYERRADLQLSYPGAHTASSVVPYWRWFCRHAGKEYDIQFLVDRYRRALMSGAAFDFAEQISAELKDGRMRFFGTDRLAACQTLRASGSDDLAIALLEAHAESHFFTELSAAFEIYNHRPDLQAIFPDILGRDHEAFGAWLAQNALKEHGCSEFVAEKFRRHSVGASLARIFSYLARREDMPAAFQDSLLSDDPEPILRDLIRDSGEGLEHTLEDVVLLRFVHQTRRHLLVPLYLELPLRRQQARASRNVEASIAMLPQDVRDAEWAVRGCEAHAACFDSFETNLDDEMRRWAETQIAPSRNVLGVLQRRKQDEGAIAVVEPRYRAAIGRMPRDAGRSAALLTHLKERAANPGVNIFGYLKSDIGVGESARGLVRAVSLLRPVNGVPLYTAQVRDGVDLPDLFQRFDYLSDTNIFVSYPHQRDDYLGMLRPEHLAGRRNIAHLAWEQKGDNPWWRVVYDRYDEIWMISDFAATPFRKMFPGRVRVVPNVLDFELFPNCDEASEMRLRGERLNFLFAFDANSSMERKNPEAVVDAFVKAFKDTPYAGRVTITLKVGGMHRPEHATRLDELMRRASRTGLSIELDGRQLSRESMLRMIASADCYVSLHHAEGFGYTLAEAMSYGVPVIASGYSGNLEYMTPDNSYLVPCTETFVKNADGPFQRGSIWGEPDIDAAAMMLRAVAENPADALAIGDRGRKAIHAKLNAAAVAETIRPYFNGSDGPVIAAMAAQ
jgi:glycosyltransferase involved in cell wall biosynthesis